MVGLTAIVAALLGLILCHVACPVLGGSEQSAGHPRLPTGHYPAHLAPPAREKTVGGRRPASTAGASRRKAAERTVREAAVAERM